MVFEIAFMPKAWEHLQAFSAREQRILLDTIEQQLRHQPNQQTRQRKPLKLNSLAGWELRVGKFRVFYDIVLNHCYIVNVIAIGTKEHNRLWLAGEEFYLL
jgi:mRNA-degrading endonuclease RelE of RelBE toxin-antitoxin system